MTNDEAEAIHQLARQLLEEDCAVETRQRIARKIIEHARAIKASCMAEPQAATYSTAEAWVAAAECNYAKALAKKVPYQTLEGPEIQVNITREQGKTAADCAQRNPWQLSPRVMANYG